MVYDSLCMSVCVCAHTCHRLKGILRKREKKKDDFIAYNSKKKREAIMKFQTIGRNYIIIVEKKMHEERGGWAVIRHQFEMIFYQ